MRKYGFKVGTHVIEMEEADEKAALKKLIDKYWIAILIAGKIELLGKEDNQ